jgi:superfamily II DNA or RNA helicase
MSSGSEGQCANGRSSARRVVAPSQASYAAEFRWEIVRARNSWANAFSYIEEDVPAGVLGFRRPQIGAIHGVHSHWSISREVGAVVMPTGTGRTEVMLAILVSTPCDRLLVIVPTDALRTQLAGKFLSLGILKQDGSKVLDPEALFPVVGMLLHLPTSVDGVDSIFEQCQVIVTTSAIAGQCPQDIQERMAYHCSHLFIDEAHHTEAPTWRAFKDRFADRPVLQFTATPFREDGRPLDGKIIYKYSLKKAQEDGYFRPIQFRSVYEFSPEKVDEALASVAIRAAAGGCR